jgi:hypothetical protein
MKLPPQHESEPGEPEILHRFAQERNYILTEPDDVKKRINELLERWSNGDPTALNDLIPLVYPDLRRIAGYLFSSERKNHT